MGYGYSRTGGLCCDSCGTTGARKRKCPYTVTDEHGHTLPWCPAPALCSPCYARGGGLRGVHNERCRDGARRAQDSADTVRKRLAVGDKRVRSAYGTWHATVPDGFVGVIFAGTPDLSDREPYLVPDADYNPGTRPFLSDYPDRQPWPGP